MTRTLGAVGFFLAMLAVALIAMPGALSSLAGEKAQAQAVAAAFTQPVPVASQAPAPPTVAMPPLVSDVLRSGVLIVVSKSTQQMHVFKDGALWATSPVSTGKRGHSTPSGVFPILQKKSFHRSNIYSNAPMPFMQRLTWRGIAIHAGRLPGYPASHGCIRLPYGFARALFGLTRAASTTVVVTNEPVRSDEQAVQIAFNADSPRSNVPGTRQQQVMTAQATLKAPVLNQSGPNLSGPGQTIQLAAAISPGDAEAHWQDLVAIHPELAGFQKVVIPAVVGARRFYRLRASAPGAHAYCAALRRAGQDCFNVS